MTAASLSAAAAEENAYFLEKHNINQHLGYVVNMVAKTKPRCPKAAILKYFVKQIDPHVLEQLGIRLSKTDVPPYTFIVLLK